MSAVDLVLTLQEHSIDYWTEFTLASCVVMCSDCAIHLHNDLLFTASILYLVIDFKWIRMLLVKLAEQHRSLWMTCV